MKSYLIYFAIKIPLMADLYLHGPVSQILSAVTGLPIE